MPFVQGRLRGEPLSVLIKSECAHCGRPVEIEVDEAMRYRVISESAEPLVFAPLVDLGRVPDPSIIDAF